MEEKVSLPIKTKIAAWWMIVIGIIGIGVVMPIKILGGGGAHGAFAIDFLLYSSLFFFLPAGFFLLERKKLAWEITIGVFSLLIIGTLLFSFWILIIPAVPFIFLLLDRKNFWKVAK